MLRHPSCIRCTDSDTQVRKFAFIASTNAFVTPFLLGNSDNCMLKHCPLVEAGAALDHAATSTHSHLIVTHSQRSTQGVPGRLRNRMRERALHKSLIICEFLEDAFPESEHEHHHLLNAVTYWTARSGPTMSNRSSWYIYASSLSRKHRSPARSSRSSTKALRTL